MKLLTLVLFSLMLQVGFAQEPTSSTVQKPTVMVIPFAKEGEQLRTLYEKEEMLHLRVAVTQTKEALDLQGITTIDFRAKLKQLKMDGSMMAGNQSSVKQRVIELSGADVYVEVEATAVEDSDGSSVTVTATAYDAFSGQTLASNVGTTKKYYTYNFERLTQRAIGYFIEDFTETMEEKFNRIIKDGRVIVVNIGFDENAAVDLDEEQADGRLLAEVIEEWIAQNAFMGNYHLQGVTATNMIFDEVRIPVRDNFNRNFRVTKFAAKLRNFLKKQDLDVTRDVVGTKVYITIN